MKSKLHLTTISMYGLEMLLCKHELSQGALKNLYKIGFLISIYVSVSGLAVAQKSDLWLSGGQNNHNTRNAASETIISPQTARNLAVKWVFTTGGDVSATPAVDENYVYFPDWAGFLYKVNASTGELAWKRRIKSYTGEKNGFARATPAIAGNMLVIGTQLGDSLGAYVLGINKHNGTLLWKTKVDDHPSAIITQGAVICKNRVYIGVSSAEEGFATVSSYPCCSFRGSMLSLDLNTGKIIWKTYIVPDVKDFSGGAVWGSTPVIDIQRNSVYIATGNNYTVPQAILNCVDDAPDQVRACVEAVNGSDRNYFDALMSLDLNTGSIKWVRSVIPFDAWNVACLFGRQNCPENAGPDYDFGQGPALFTVGTGANKRELLGAGQKSGTYWVVDPDTGNDVWSTKVGPGATLGGLEWGSAVDEKQVYVAVANADFVPYTLTKGPDAGRTVMGGFWASLDAATGAVIWQNASSRRPAIDPLPGAIAINTGPVTVANGVVFAGTMDAAGTMFAFNAKTGLRLWTFESGGSVNSAPAVVDGTVYWGSGYENINGTPNNKLYAFTPDPNKSQNAVEDIAALSTSDANRSLSVYPNPAKNEVQITSGNKGNISRVQLYDLAGRLIKDNRIGESSSYKLDLRSVPTGSYIINITTSTNTIAKKVVVTH